MNLGAVANRVRIGETVTFEARGSSMTPKIKNGQTVSVRRRDRNPKKGDIVLAKVRGQWYLHLVTGLNPPMVQISNNHGHVNGWTHQINVVGFLVDD